MIQCLFIVSLIAIATDTLHDHNHDNDNHFITLKLIIFLSFIIYNYNDVYFSSTLKEMNMLLSKWSRRWQHGNT